MIRPSLTTCPSTGAGAVAEFMTHATRVIVTSLDSTKWMFIWRGDFLVGVFRCSRRLGG